ncbi:MAG: glycosyltransferase family 1 protein [Opitutaceae bacterium]|nr:glycosyltransferase family 1 protein [Opitutaceae bacterium]
MSVPLLIDLSHTCHTRARTGIQRVVRSLRAALGDAGVAVTHDPYARRWRQLQRWEEDNLKSQAPAPKRGAHWSMAARFRSRASRVFTRAGGPHLPENCGLVVPEVFSPAVARAWPELFAVVQGPRVAIFHDAIALKLPEVTPARTVARFPAYMSELLAFDGVVAISEESRDSLIGYWDWLGARQRPAVHTIGWGIDFEVPPASTGPRGESTLPVVLCVGSIEGRKNHEALLDAGEALWGRGLKFTLHLIGLAQPQTGAAALVRIRELQAAGRPLRYDGPVTDDALNSAYAESAFTVYPSLMEGFGLPVLESLAHGRPCICSGGGALGESARDGGCVTLDSTDADAIARAIEKLLKSPAEVARLQGEARARKFKTWAAYVVELRGWLRALPR